MSWDLAISNFKDLVYSPKRDLLTVSGLDLLHQRIMLRLLMKRGSWVFDDTKELGGNLDLALRMSQPDAIDELTSLVVEALDPISNEIVISSVEVLPTQGNNRSVDLVISYQRPLTSDQAGALENSNLVITIPFAT